jgi:hypothetical protein
MVAERAARLAYIITLSAAAAPLCCLLWKVITTRSTVYMYSCRLSWEGGGREERGSQPQCLTQPKHFTCFMNARRRPFAPLIDARCP